jgi:hypothetical protein
LDGNDRGFDLDSLSLGSLGILSILTLAFFITHWGAYVIFEEAFVAALGGRFRALDILYSIVGFVVTGVTVWFLVLTLIGVTLKDVRLVLYGASLCVPSLLLIYIADLIRVGALEDLTIVSLLLILVSVEQVLEGVSKGFVRENRLSVSTGDWRGVLRGVRLAVFGMLMIVPGVYTYLYNLPGVTVEMTDLYSSLLGVIVMVMPFLEAYILLLLVMRLLSPIFFVKCKLCNSIMLKRNIPTSGWDSEHTLRHLHCPRCGAIIDL